MTKTYTEQWREGTLPEGFYYVNGKWINYYSKDDGHFDDGGVEEVLAPVPSYEEYKRLQEQIKEANNVICGLYHLVIDKKAASGVVCDYLVKYGKPFDVKSGM